MFASTISNKWSETTSKNEPTIELVVFDIGDVSFGIPIYKIDRIISNVHLDENPTLTQNVEITALSPVMRYILTAESPAVS